MPRKAIPGSDLNLRIVSILATGGRLEGIRCPRDRNAADVRESDRKADSQLC